MLKFEANGKILLEHVELGAEGDPAREGDEDLVLELRFELSGGLQAVLGTAEDGADAHELVVSELEQSGRVEDFADSRPDGGTRRGDGARHIR